MLFLGFFSDMINNSNKPASALSSLQDFVEPGLHKVNGLILAHAANNASELIPAITEYITSAKGKRIRPILTLACASMFNYRGESDILLAAAVEYIHTATLLHDDVVDESKSRRGRLPANQKWGNKAAILVGDFLFAQAFELMVGTNSLPALSALSKAAAIIAEGEVLQLESIENQYLTEQQYYGIIKRKTASLFAAACEAGAIIGGATAEEINALKEYGLNLGMLFQVLDDILDYTANEEEFGKKVGKDFEEGKYTLPLILALMVADKQDREKIISIMQSSRQKESFNQILEIANKYDVFNLCRNRVDIFLMQAIDSLNVISNNNIKQLLISLVQELKDRSS